MLDPLKWPVKKMEINFNNLYDYKQNDTRRNQIPTVCRGNATRLLRNDDNQTSAQREHDKRERECICEKHVYKPEENCQ